MSYRECDQPMNGGSECVIDDVTGKIDEKYQFCDPGTLVHIYCSHVFYFLNSLIGFCMPISVIKTWIKSVFISKIILQF